MESTCRKRKNHLPQQLEHVKLPKSRCSGKKFLTVMDTLSNEKKVAIVEIGFGGLLQMKCKELRYELIAWIIDNYDIAYHRIHMATRMAVPVTPQDVSEVMGIPNNGVDIVVHNRRATTDRTYSMQLLEENLHNLPVGAEFKKTFLIFACATILAPNSKLEGMRDVWDAIWDNDVAVPKNWAKFVLHFLEEGVKEFRKSHQSYIRGCMLFLQLFYMAKFQMPSVNVEMTCPFSAAWTDDLIKRRLASEIDTFGGYGHMAFGNGEEVRPQRHSHEDATTSGHGHEPIQQVHVIEARIMQTAEQILALTSTLVRDVATLRTRIGRGPPEFPVHPTDSSQNLHGENDIDAENESGVENEDGAENEFGAENVATSPVVQ